MLSGQSAHNKLPSVSEIWDSGSSSLNDIMQSQASKTQWRLEESASKTTTLSAVLSASKSYLNTFAA